MWWRTVVDLELACLRVDPSEVRRPRPSAAVHPSKIHHDINVLPQLPDTFCPSRHLPVFDGLGREEADVEGQPVVRRHGQHPPRDEGLVLRLIGCLDAREERRWKSGRLRFGSGRRRRGSRAGLGLAFDLRQGSDEVRIVSKVSRFLWVDESPLELKARVAAG